MALRIENVSGVCDTIARVNISLSYINSLTIIFYKVLLLLIKILRNFLMTISHLDFSVIIFLICDAQIKRLLNKNKLFIFQYFNYRFNYR